MTCAEAGRKGGEVRGLSLMGNGNPNAKLSPAQVTEMRRLKFRWKLTPKQLAERYPVTEGHIRRILKGEFW